MCNYFFLVGRVCNDIELKVVGDGKKVVNLFLATTRDFKNMDGTYSTDFFPIALWEFMAEVAVDVLKKGSIVGIKGRLASKKETLASGAVITTTELVGEKIVFSGDNGYRAYPEETDELEEEK